MDDYALVLNAGSSSLKFCVYRRPAAQDWMLGARGQIEGIGSSPRFSAKDGTGAKMPDGPVDTKAVRDAASALDALAAWLRSTFGAARILGVGHRVVHGGARFDGPVVVTPQVLEELEALVALAPLHQPYNLAAIAAVSERLPDVPQVACFDTSFHRGQPAVAEIVPLPADIRSRGVQRYGFHGLSYEYIASVLPDVAPSLPIGA
jgi:acetate kinase